MALSNSYKTQWIHIVYNPLHVSRFHLAYFVNRQESKRTFVIKKLYFFPNHWNMESAETNVNLGDVHAYVYRQY